MKKIASLILILLGLTLFAVKAKAEVFEVYLYYNPGTKEIKFDEKKNDQVVYNPKKELFITEFLQQSEQSKGKFAIGLYDKNDQELLSTNFEPKSGAFELELPYYSLAQAIKILDSTSGQVLASRSISQFSTCNANGICEYELGETLETCIGDCGSSQNKYSQQTQDLLQKDQGIVSDPATGQRQLYDEKFFANKKPALSPAGSSDATDSSESSSNPLAVSSVFNWRMILFLFFVFLGGAGISYFIRKKIRRG